MYDKLVIVVLIWSVTIYSMTNSDEKPKIVSNNLEGWANCPMTLMGFSEKKINILCLVCPNFQGDFFVTSMFYTNTSSPLRNVLDEDQFVVEDVDTWFQHHDSLPCRCAGAGLGFSPSSCISQPRVAPLHKVSHHCQPFFVSTSRSEVMFFSLCSSVQHYRTISWEFGSSGNVGLLRTGWQQGWVLLKGCGWFREVHQCAYCWVQHHFHHVQNEGKFHFTFPLIPTCRVKRWVMAGGKGVVWVAAGS